MGLGWGFWEVGGLELLTEDPTAVGGVVCGPSSELERLRGLRSSSESLAGP